MGEDTDFGFAKLVPGFEFLQNLAKGGAAFSQLPTLSSWVAPTLNVEELDKRITELKSVQFWLEQNGKALGATIQALEVQKMTLATLEGMNFNLGELADALQMKTPASWGAAPAAAKAGASKPAGGKAQAEAQGKGESKAEAGAAAGGTVDPMQWWSALTEQFQQIAAHAMQDVAQATAPGGAREAGAGPSPSPAAGKRAAGKAAPRQSAAGKPARRSAGK